MYGNLIGYHSGLGHGPFEVRYHGLYKSGSGGWTGDNSNSPFLISPGSLYEDTALLLGGFGDSTGGDFITPTINNRVGTRLVKSAYNAFWWAWTDITDSSIVVSASTSGIHYSLFCFTVSGAALGTNFSGIAAASGSSNNDNSVNAVINGGLIGDIYIGVGTKPGTGATNNWGGITGGPGMTALNDSRIGTSGSGSGGLHISAAQAVNGNQTFTASGSDSSKAITLAMIRLRGRT